MTALATAPPPTTTRIHVTPDDLPVPDADRLFEWVDGRQVEKQMGYDANWTAGEIPFRLKLHLRDHPTNDVLPEQLLQSSPDDPTGFRRPDIAFIAAGRVPDALPSGHLPVRPDFAVEVVSPTDNAYELQQKLDDYRSAAIPLAWVVYSHVQVVQQHPLGGPITELRPGDTLTGGAVLPGLAVAVAELFPPAAE